MSEYFERAVGWLEGIPWLKAEFAGNSVTRWGIAMLVVVVSWIVIRVILAVIRRRASAFTEKTKTGWDDGINDVVAATRSWFLLLVSLYIGSLVVKLPERTLEVVQTGAILALLLQAAFWASELLKFSISHYLQQRRESDPGLATAISAMSFIGNLVLWAVVVLLALDNIGIDVTALVAGLGVGGIAVALAAQNILGDLFASLSIVIDKPFVLGDFIIVGDKVGTVEKVGLKTTRLRALTGEQLVFANTDLLSSRVHNYKRMQQRRIVFKIGVTYETPIEKLRKIPEIIREIVESQPQTQFDRSHFLSLDDFALAFETVYYVAVPDYNVYMDTQQAINFALMERMKADGIEFAYPTQKLFLEQTGAQ